MSPSFCGLPRGRILGTQTFRAAGVFRILPTHTFQVAVAVAFYFNKLFGLPSASQLHFSYTNFSGGRGFAFYLRTHFRGDSYANLKKMIALLLKEAIRKWGIHRKHFRALRATFIIWWKMRGTIWRKMPIFKEEHWVWVGHFIWKNSALCARPFFIS